jgi:hypothetical protein
MLNGDVSSYVKYQILDLAIKWVWMAAPWRWTVGEIANIPLLDNTSDYNVGSTPADFLKLQAAYWSDGQTRKPLEVVDSLPSSGIIAGPMQYITWVPGSPNKVRLGPKPGTNNTGKNTLVLIYKKSAPTITSSNFGTAGAWVIDDDWYPVLFTFVLAYAYTVCHDPRAGQAQWDEATRKYKYTGLFGQGEAMLENMRMREALPMEWDFQPDVKAGRR